MNAQNTSWCLYLNPHKKNISICNPMKDEIIWITRINKGWCSSWSKQKEIRRQILNHVGCKACQSWQQSKSMLRGKINIAVHKCTTWSTAASACHSSDKNCSNSSGNLRASVEEDSLLTTGHLPRKYWNLHLHIWSGFCMRGCTTSVLEVFQNSATQNHGWPDLVLTTVLLWAGA